jgi:hypothetical protein
VSLAPGSALERATTTSSRRRTPRSSKAQGPSGKQVGVLGVELEDHVLELAPGHREAERPEDGTHALASLHGGELELLGDPRVGQVEELHRRAWSAMLRGC